MVRFYVGIDIGALRHQVAVIDDTGNLHAKPFAIPNSGAGFATLLARLHPLGSPEEILLGMEATGCYGWALHHCLSRHGYRALVLNPMQTQAFAKTGIRRTKTDPIDAQGIAQLLRFGKVHAAIIPDERALRLRELTRYRSIVVGLLHRCVNLLRSRVYRTFPEFVARFPMLWLPTPLGLLEKYPLPGDLARLSPVDVAQEIHRASRGRIGRSSTLALHEAAQSSIGIPLAGDVYALQIQGLVGVIRDLQGHLRSVTERLKEVLAEVPQPLTTIPGVGEITAASILGEIVDVRLFESPKKLVAFAGFDPSTFQSGLFLGNRAHLSKRGSPPLRRALWQAAFAAVRWCPELRAYYQHKRKEGKHAKVALGAVGRKLIHLIWRLLTDNRPYEKRAASE